MRAIAASLVSLCLLQLAPAAQDETPPVPAPPTAKPASTAAPKAVSVGIRIPISGLTPENEGTVEKRLAALRWREFLCPECGLRAPKDGECSDCKRPLEAKERPLLESQSVYKPPRGRATVVITPATGTEVRLSQVESSLKELEVTVSRTAMILVPADTVVFTGSAARADADALVKAFAAAELEVEVELVADATEIHVRLKSGAESYGSVAKAAKAAKLGAPNLGEPDLLYRGRAQ